VPSAARRTTSSNQPSNMRETCLICNKWLANRFFNTRHYFCAYCTVNLQLWGLLLFIIFCGTIQFWI
jgi:hypothetical protein